MYSFENSIATMHSIFSDTTLARLMYYVTDVKKLPNPFLGLASKFFIPFEHFYTIIKWYSNSSPQQMLVIIALANLDEEILEKLYSVFVIIDEYGITKLIHDEKFSSESRPHPSLENLFTCEGGCWYIIEGTNSKHIAESIFKYLLNSNGKVSFKKIDTDLNSNSSVNTNPTTSPSVNTSSTEAFPSLPNRKSTKNSNTVHNVWQNPIVLDNQNPNAEPNLLQILNELSEEQLKYFFSPSSYDVEWLLKNPKVLEVLMTINTSIDLTKDFENLKNLVNKLA